MGRLGSLFLFSSSVDRGGWPALFAYFFPPGLYTKLGMVSYEAINMLRKGQISDVEKGDSMKQVAFIASLFGVAI